jgi:hypothetical protein
MIDSIGTTAVVALGTLDISPKGRGIVLSNGKRNFSIGKIHPGQIGETITFGNTTDASKATHVVSARQLYDAIEDFAKQVAEIVKKGVEKNVEKPASASK